MCGALCLGWLGGRGVSPRVPMAETARSAAFVGTENVMTIECLWVAARRAVVVRTSLLTLLTLVTGCASSFGNGYGYDEQACVERALRRSADAETALRASREFIEECRQGGAEACSALGVMNEVGVGVPRNIAKAVALYERACVAHNQRGCTNLGIARAQGLGGVADPAAGVRLLEPACDGGDARACVFLANMHVQGVSVSKDLAQAARLFDRACTGEEASACLALGDMLATDKRLDNAAEYYGKGCLNGDATACGRLGIGATGAGHSRGEVASVAGR